MGRLGGDLVPGNAAGARNQHLVGYRFADWARDVLAIYQSIEEGKMGVADLAVLTRAPDLYANHFQMLWRDMLDLPIDDIPCAAKSTNANAFLRSMAQWPYGPSSWDSLRIRLGQRHPDLAEMNASG